MEPEYRFIRSRQSFDRTQHMVRAWVVSLRNEGVKQLVCDDPSRYRVAQVCDPDFSAHNRILVAPRTGRPPSASASPKAGAGVRRRTNIDYQVGLLSGLGRLECVVQQFRHLGEDHLPEPPSSPDGPPPTP